MSKGGARGSDHVIMHPTVPGRPVGGSSPMERQQRVHEIFMRCRHKVLHDAGGLYSLPGEVIGAEIAEALMRAAYQQMLNRALAQRRQAGDDPVRPGDIRLASPLIVP